MKKISLVATALAAVLLAGCAETTATTGTSCSECPEPETTIVGYTTFEEQLKAYGITGYTYEDPNAAYYTPEGDVADEDVDVEMGGSTNVAGEAVFSESYTSYQTIEYAVSRINTYWYTYTWEKPTADDADAPTATTLEEAAKLENAEHVSEIFPNDGEAYLIRETRGWPYAAISWATVDADGTPRNSVLIPGAAKNETTGEWQITLYSGVKTFLMNIVRTGKAQLMMYEYDGQGAVCQGGRLALSLDLEASYLMVAGERTTITLGMDFPAATSMGRLIFDIDHLYNVG